MAMMSTPDHRVIVAWLRWREPPKVVAANPRSTNTTVNPAMNRPVCQAIRGRWRRSPSLTSATSLGRTLLRNQTNITRWSGVLIVAMALYMLGSLVLRAPGLYQERRWHPKLSRFGPFAAPVAGIAFGFGWTPCIGPVLSAVLGKAATQGEATQGAILLLFYSAGLGIPFMATGLAFGRLSGALNWVKRHSTAITASSALALGFFGVLLAMNQFTWLTAKLSEGLQAIGLDRLLTLG